MSSKLMLLMIFVATLAGVSEVQAGGYVLKGGVMDFGKPLDYFDDAVHAGYFIKLNLTQLRNPDHYFKHLEFIFKIKTLLHDYF